jgi:glycosyltransferase involved in cell wall biosynthesis
MAVHNPSAPYLHAQVASIFSQTYPIDELLVIDDGALSTELVLTTIQDLVRTIPTAPPKITIITHTRNLGHTKAFSSHLTSLSSDVIFFSDQDDVWLPNKVSTCINYFASHPADYCLTHDFYVVDSELNFVSPTAMELARIRKISARTVGNGFATAIRSAVASFVARATDARGGHDGWIRTFGELLRIRGIIKEPLALWRRHLTAHGVRNRAAETPVIEKLLKASDYCWRSNSYRNALTDYQDMESWFSTYKFRFPESPRGEIQKTLDSFLYELKIRESILFGSILTLLRLLPFIQTRTRAGDMISRIRGGFLPNNRGSKT